MRDELIETNERENVRKDSILVWVRGVPVQNPLVRCLGSV